MVGGRVGVARTAAPVERIMRRLKTTQLGLGRRLTPARVGLLGSAVALLIVLARLMVAADGDVSRFVVAGDLYADPATVDPDIHVFEGSGGYDGQFFWRLAVEPDEWDLEPAHGVRLDSAYRLPRIAYPVVAWLAAAGQPGLVTWTLVGINIVALGALAGLGAALAERAGKQPVWGLLVASAPGLLFALARDLAEPVTLAALVAGIVALRPSLDPASHGPLTASAVGLADDLAGAGRLPGGGAGHLGGVTPDVTGSAGELAGHLHSGLIDGRDGRSWWGLVAGVEARHREVGAVVAALVWAFAVLAREQALVVVAGYGLWRVGRIVIGRQRPSWGDLPWVLPGLVFVAWQGVLWAATGELPLTAATGNNLSLPFVDLVRGIGRWLRGDLARPEMLAPVQLVLLAVLVVVAVRDGAARLAPHDRWLAVSLALTATAGVSLALPVWAGPADLRQLSDVFVLSWVVLLLGTERLPRWLVSATGGIWLATVAFRVAAI